MDYLKKARIITPTLTFFDEDGSLDTDSNKRLIEHLIAGGVDGLLVLGSTGEFPAMPLQQKRDLIDLYIATVDRRAMVLVGTGCMTDVETVSLSNYALDQGADAVLIVVPYYFTVDDEAIYAYYVGIAEKLRGNMMLYCYPARTANDVNLKVTKALVDQYPNIIGYKDSTGDIAHTRELIFGLREDHPDFDVYSGFDSDFADNVMIGGAGGIAALSNVVPELWSCWVQAFNAQDFAAFVTHGDKIVRLMQLYGVKKNFIPVLKAALNMMGWAVPEHCIAPSLPISPEEREEVKQILGILE